MFRLLAHLSGQASIVAAALSVALISPAANAHQAVQRFNQAEQRDAGGRLAVEASVITIVNCNGAGENGRQYYIYQYVKRPGVRVILPPDWSHAVGAREWPAYDQAVAAACGGNAPVGAGLTGAWRLTTNCTWTNPPWSAVVNLTQGAGGALTATTSDDKLNSEWVAPDQSGSWGSKMRSQVSGATFNLLLHPKGWVSVLEFTGTVNGSRIDGRIHHYSGDDCNFTMVR